MNATEAFSMLKIALTQAPVLALLDFSKTFTLETDASGVGIGAVLSQDQRHIAYFSKKLTDRMQRQSAYTREFFAITKAIAKFRHYLLGHKFIIKTNQKSLRSLTDQVVHTPEQQNWLHKLIGYDFTIEYKPGKENVAADSLSRSFMMAISQPKLQLLPELREAMAQDHHLRDIMQLCLQNNPPSPYYSVLNQLLYWKGRLVLPKGHELVKKIL